MTRRASDETERSLAELTDLPLVHWTLPRAVADMAPVGRLYWGESLGNRIIRQWMNLRGVYPKYRQNLVQPTVVTEVFRE